METGEITFIKCPYGDSFPVRKTANLSSGSQHVICPKCRHEFDINLSRSVERLSQEKLRPASDPEAESLRHAG
jgi:transposase-like protein